MFTAAVLAGCLGIQACGIPGDVGGVPAASVSVAPASSSLADAPSMGAAFRRAVLRPTIPLGARGGGESRRQSGSSSLPRTTKGMYVLAGVLAGLYAGGHIGAEIADDRNPDSALGGALIGAPIGAALGGIVVWRLLK
jgi:hypothetical protein